MSKNNKVLKEKELATKLVSDDPQERIDCIENLKDILRDTKINEPKYKKIWKALYYSLWVADKVDIQMDLASRIAKIVYQIANTSEDNLFAWLRANFDVFHREWSKLDYWRTNKFLSLARFCLNEIYKMLEVKKYNQKLVNTWNEILISHILSENIAERSSGLTLHVIQIFVQVLHELNNPSFKILQQLLEPFLNILSQSQDKVMKKSIVEYVFKGLIENMKQGKFKNFSIEKYAEVLLKKASSKEGVLDANRKFLYEIAKEYQQNRDLVAIDQSINLEEEEGNKAITEDSNISSTSTKKKKKSEIKQQNEQEQPQTNEKKTKKEKIKEKQQAKEAAKQELNGQIAEDEEVKEVIADKKTKKDKKKKTQKEQERELVLHNGNEDLGEADEGNEENDLYELPEDWDEEDLDLEALAPYLNGEFDGELTEEEYAEILAKIQSNPSMYFPGESQEFFENFTKEYFEKLSRAKKNQLTHNKKVKIHLNKVKIQEFDKEVSLGSHKKKAHTTELKSILKKKEKKEPIKKIEESPVQKIQSVDTKKKTKKKVKF